MYATVGRGGTWREHICNRDKSGALYWVDTTIAPIKNNAGKIVKYLAIRFEITKQKQMEKELQKTAERLEFVLNALDVGIWDLDLANQLFYASEQWFSMLGEPPIDAPMTLQSFIDRLHPEDVEHTMGTFEESLSNPCKHFDVEFRMRMVQGSYLWIRSMGKVVDRDASGNPVRMIGQHVDISESKVNQERLHSAMLGAQAASKAKSEFLANMSHEIRTPMNGVIGMTDLLLETPLNEDQQDMVQTVMNSGESLLRIINDMLDFSKIEAGKLDLYVAEFCLLEVLEDLRKLYFQRNRTKELHYSLDIASEVPARLRGDSDRFRQVMVNLLGNAIKFTPEGGSIHVRVSVKKQYKKRITLQFSISDTGIGIAKEKQQLIFDSFTQVDSSISKTYGGTGLGLSISSMLIALMNGKIWLKSEEGEGTTFYFTAEFEVVD